MSNALSQARQKIYTLEKALTNRDDCKYMDDIPLVHRFAPGLYIREITLPANHVLTTHIHATEHVAIISKGKVTIFSEDGEETVEAPYTTITKIGTKRAIYTHSETVWTTIHLNEDNETDIDILVSRMTFKDEQALLEAQ